MTPKHQSRYALFALLSFFILNNSCKKDTKSGPQQVSDPDIAQAKSWYQNSFSGSGSAAGSSGNQTLNSTGHQKINLNKIIKPDWSHAAKYSRFNKDVIELPADSGGRFGFDLNNATANQVYSNKKYSRTSLLMYAILCKSRN